MGAAAISAMLDRLREPTLPARDILLNFDLVVRSSCGTPKRERNEKGERLTEVL
jgi:DNA-binding LacI/PurR family transcriptional regulator